MPVASLHFFDSESAQSRGLAPLNSHYGTNSPSGVTGLWEGSPWLPDFAGEAGRRRQAVVRHCIKRCPKTAKTEEKGTSTLNISQQRPQDTDDLLQHHSASHEGESGP